MRGIPSGTLALLIGLAACGRPEPPAVSGPVRLVALAATAAVESAIDLSDPAALAEFGVIGREREAFDDLVRLRIETGPEHFGATVATGRVELAADGPDRVLAITGPAAVFRLFDLRGEKRPRLRLGVDAEPGAAFRAVAVGLEPDWFARLEGEPSWTRAVGRMQAPIATWLAPEGPPGAAGPSVFSHEIHHRNVVDRVLVGIFVTAGVVRVTELELAWLLPFLPARTDSPWVDHVEVERDRRESLVFCAPGSMRFSLRAPAGSPRLVYAVTALGGATATEVVTIARATADDRVVERSIAVVPERVAGARGWVDAELDLTPLAGRKVELELSATCVGPGATPVGVAFGAPVIEAGSDSAALDVVLVSLDTVRADRLSLYGYPRATSPALESLAPSAAVFESAVAPTSWTLPSHVTLLTGHLPDRHRVYSRTSSIDPAAAPLLAPEFLSRGYRTVAVTGGGYVHHDFGFAHGFEEYGTEDPATEGLPEGVDRPQSRAVRERVLSLLRGPRRRPLFLFVHTYAAHVYRAPDADLRAVGVAPADMPWVRAVTPPAALTPAVEAAGSLRPFEQDVARYELLYDAGLRVADRLVGDIVRALEESGRRDRTLLVVVSDHGEELGEHGYLTHGHDLFEELIHVPLVIRGPGVTPRRVAEVVTLADVAPTVLDLCGLGAGSCERDGRSLAPLLRGEPQPTGPALALSDSSLRGRRHALRGSRWKLVLQERGGAAPGPFLFDLSEDPAETTNRAAEQPAVTAQMTRTLEGWVRRLAAGSGAAREQALSPERAAELDELGYVGGR